MAAVRDYNSIIKGSTLMVFIDNKPIGFATSHTFSATLNTSEVACKDCGDYNAVLPQNISWEVTAENLYSDAGEATYMNAVTNKTLVELKFAKVETWYSQGVAGSQGSSTDWAAGEVIAQGQAYITSFQINAPSGENATMSVTFTGNGSFTTDTPGPQEPQEPQEPQGN